MIKSLETLDRISIFCQYPEMLVTKTLKFMKGGWQLSIYDLYNFGEKNVVYADAKSVPSGFYFFYFSELGYHKKWTEQLLCTFSHSLLTCNSM
jgi:hypothetical protein